MIRDGLINEYLNIIEFYRFIKMKSIQLDQETYKQVLLKKIDLMSKLKKHKNITFNDTIKSFFKKN